LFIENYFPSIINYEYGYWFIAIKYTSIAYAYFISCRVGV